VTQEQVGSVADGAAAAQRYLFANAWERARRRLDLLEQYYDPTSFRWASALVRDGWRCLDAGAGGGSFARWLGEQVGATGTVVAADIDVQQLHGIAASNVEVREMNLVTDELPQGEFDFVHTRHVLVHIAERDAVLGRLCAALRPGGVLMLEEGDVSSVTAATGAYGNAWRTFVRAAEAGGGRYTGFAFDLPARLGALGLVDVDAELDAQIFRGGSASAEFWILSLEQALPAVAAIGGPDDLIARGQAELSDARHWFHGPTTVGTWGRRPAD
jgi:SAM-dependent methyltransferase